MRKKKILVIDDEQGFTAMLRLNLESTGDYEVEVENESLQAFKTALRFHPDLILLDVIMPDKEGPDVASEILSDESLHNTPIVFLTATVTKNEVEAQGGRIGGHLFLAKPSSLDDLVTSINENIDLKK